MKIAVVGAGAMGSLFGALLAEAGAEVWLHDIWREHVETVNRNGLTIERDGRTRQVAIKATMDRREIDGADLVIIFVKATQTAQAAETASRLVGSEGHILTLQNGMGNADVIAELVDAGRILAGTTAHGATLLGPGSIRHAGIGATVIGMWAGGEQGLRRARRFADDFTRAGIATEAVEDVRRVIWDKLLVNIGINAITALTGIKNGELLDLETTRELSRMAVQEAQAVADAHGVQTRDDAVAHVFQVSKATALNRSSMGQDVDHKRQTEIAAINGFIVREAKKLGLAAPVNFALTALIETLQYHYK
jgi:2-dehydropantoate 2-reductase